MPTTTLDDLLGAQGITKVDFLSMDIEGSQLEALAGFSISRFRPDLVCIEASGPRPGHKELVAAYFEKNGYERIERYRKYEKANWFFKPVE